MHSLAPHCLERTALIERYSAHLPVTEATPVVSLFEGSTPLIRADRLSHAIDDSLTIYLKCEGMNPTGSFKDRGMTVAVSKAAEEGARAVICASTGNTAASAAAYAARAGLTCAVLLPKGEVALGKVSQSLVHGATVIAISGNFDDALRVVKEITTSYPVTLVNSINPYRIEGQKTGAYEVCDELGDAPQFHAIPVGNAGNITAYWKGYREYFELGKTTRLPRMLGFQAEGAAPIVRGCAIEDPQTLATAIRIGHPASWETAVEARDASGGVIDCVTDDEIVEAYRMLASLEGVFCEPASAASVAGVRKLAAAGYFTEPCEVVCVLTGHGLKDPNRAVAVSPAIVELPPDINTIVRELGL
jgi:threonine synthase